MLEIDKKKYCKLLQNFGVINLSSKSQKAKVISQGFELYLHCSKRERERERAHWSTVCCKKLVEMPHVVHNEWGP